MDLTYVPLARREGFRCLAVDLWVEGGERRDDLTFFPAELRLEDGTALLAEDDASLARQLKDAGVYLVTLSDAQWEDPLYGQMIFFVPEDASGGAVLALYEGEPDSSTPLPSIRFPWSCPGARSEPCKKEQIRLNNITLIGMPGSGKSTVGVLLAKALGFQFVDVDLLIQQREGALLQELLDNRAWSPFWTQRRRPSAPWPARAPSSPPEAAPSAGRGDRPPEGPGPGGLPPRPSVGAGAADTQHHHPGHRHGPGQTLADVYAAREPLYRRYADLTVDVGEGRGLEETVAAVLQGLLGLNTAQAQG